MDLNTVTGVFFSPTQTTRTIVENIAKGIDAREIRMMDITKRSHREAGLPEFGKELVILAAPVYYGRIPEEAAPFFAEIYAGNTPAVPVVVYGNRAYDDALIELVDISVDRGFIPVAAGAFIGEHSYSIPGRHIAHNRPDETDIEKAIGFGRKIRLKLDELRSIPAKDALSVPGNRPYMEPTNLNMIKMARKEMGASLTPDTDENLCTQCNECVTACPASAIDPEDVTKIDKFQCMICFACVKSCPSQAKQMTEPQFNAAIEQLQKGCELRKEPELFL